MTNYHLIKNQKVALISSFFNKNIYLESFVLAYVIKKHVGQYYYTYNLLAVKKDSPLLELIIFYFINSTVFYYIYNILIIFT